MIDKKFDFYGHAMGENVDWNYSLGKLYGNELVEVMLFVSNTGFMLCDFLTSY